MSTASTRPRAVPISPPSMRLTFELSGISSERITMRRTSAEASPAAISVKVEEPVFESQTKTKLGSLKWDRDNQR